MTQYLKEQVKRIEDFRDKIHDFKETLASRAAARMIEENPDHEDEAERYHLLDKKNFPDAAERYNEWRNKDHQEELDDLSRIFGIDTEKPKLVRSRSSDLKTLLIATIIGGLIGTAIGMLVNVIFS